MKALRTPFFLEEIEDFGLTDEFLTNPDTTNKYALTAPNSGTAAVSGVGGILALTPSGGSPAANDEAYLASKISIFQPLAGQPLYAEALVQFTEANTNNMNCLFGLASGVASGLLVTGSAGPRASGALVVLYKQGGGTVWRCQSRNGSTFTDSISTMAAGGSKYQHLRVEVLDVTSAQATVAFRVDGQILRDANNQWIKHTLPLASIAACQLVVGLRNGSSSAETLNIDWLGCWQRRALPPGGP